MPPLGDSTCPVTNVESGPARNSAAAAISSAVPRRPRGVCIAIRRFCSGSNGDSSGVLFVNSKNADKQVQSYEDDLQKLSDRMDMLLARYSKQFSAMESIVGESKSLGTSLTSTFAGMSNMYKNN